MKKLTLSSKDKSSGNNNNCKFILKHPIKNVNGIVIESLSIDNNYYTVMTDVNDLVYINDGTSYKATLDQGIYTIQELVTEIQKQVRSAYSTDNLHEVTFVTLTKKVQFYHPTTPFILEFGTYNKTIAKSIGYDESDTSSLQTHLSDRVYNLNYSKEIIIHSSILASDKYYTTEGTKPILFIQSINTSFGENLTYNNNGENITIKYHTPKVLKNIDICITFDDYETLIPINGYFRMVFSIF